MGSVRAAGARRMGPVRALLQRNSVFLNAAVQHGLPPVSRGAIGKESPEMADLGYVVLTLAVFGVLFLILKGIERFER
jgi:hypothetical protein